MGLLHLFLVALVSAAVQADDSCPTKNELAPCTCDGEGVNCMGAAGLDQIRKAFRANFKYGGVRSVWIQGTKITKVPADLFGKIKSQQFYIEVNNITDFDVDALSASETTLNLLSLFGNKITTMAYNKLSKYNRLGTLNLGKNLITSIPANAFDNRYLSTLILTQNKISSIGPNAFGKLPSLTKLELAMNALTSLGPLSLSISSHSAGLQISLAANAISEVSPTAFKDTTPQVVYMMQNKLTSLKKDAFGDLVTRAAQRGGAIEVSYNPFTCKGCDYLWLVENKDLVASKFAGFICPDGRRMMDLTRANIGC